MAASFRIPVLLLSLALFTSPFLWSSVCAVTVDEKVSVEVDVDAAVKAAAAETLNMNSDNDYTLQQKMALSARILARQGHGDTLSGQITCRNGDGTMWVNQYGVPIDVVTASDFIRIDGDLNLVEGEGFPNRATRFHHHVYKKRPDIQCAVHSHPPATSALAQVGEELLVSHMDVMAFYEDVQYLPEWPGIPFGDEEGEIISGVLGNHWAALLAHHGLMVGGRTIEEATYRAYFFERAAKMTLDAMAAVGGDMSRLKKTKRDLSVKARDWRISEGPVKAHWNGWAKIVIQEQGTPF